ncbi:PIN domain-containing protein [Acidiplasma sp.]|uniref:type II toxin-antitoxin system VapC family toxin n=1 Tax=Acidiplasma sp. TaxID=1872114 RepID=UPI00258DD67E|nr:PIN domain-containing protein [Acidiplasma sp.]
MHYLGNKLTFDEIIWIIKKNRNFEDAISAGEAFLNMPGLNLVDINQDLLALSMNIMKRYKTSPRDSIHAATAITQKANIIISEDSDFDKIKELKRKSIIDFKMH